MMRLICWMFGLVYADVEEPLIEHKMRVWAPPKKGTPHAANG